MAKKSNGEFIPGTLAVPVNYPDPSKQNVNTQPMNAAYDIPAAQTHTTQEKQEDL